VAVLASVQPLPDAEYAKAYAGKRPRPMVPESVVQRIAAKDDRTAQRAEGIEIALQTVRRLSALRGLRGLEVRGDGDADIAVEFIEKSGLGTD
jgi:hypothetical protein